MKIFDNPMRQHVLSLPRLIMEQVNDLQKKITSLLNYDDVESITNIILVGCGDSYAANLSIKDFLNEYSNKNIEVVSSIEFSRLYPSSKLNEETLVLFISNSGRTSRVVEAAKRAKKYNCKIFSITSNEESELAEVSNYKLMLKYSEMEAANGVREYTVSQIALLVFTLRQAYLSDLLTENEVNSILDDAKKLSQAMPKWIEIVDEKCLEISKRIGSDLLMDFIGSGSDYSASYFGQAKFVEAFGSFNSINNSEDWLHMSSFVLNPERIHTFLVADTNNNALSRNIELAGFIEQLGRPFYIITNENNNVFDNFSAEVLKYPESKYEVNKIFVNSIPFSLIAGYVSEINNEEYGRGEKGKYSFTKDGYCVKNSQIIIY